MSSSTVDVCINGMMRLASGSTAPSISSLLPASGAIATLADITGTNLGTSGTGRSGACPR